MLSEIDQILMTPLARSPGKKLPSLGTTLEESTRALELLVLTLNGSSTWGAKACKSFIAHKRIIRRAK